MRSNKGIELIVYSAPYAPAFGSSPYLAKNTLNRLEYTMINVVRLYLDPGRYRILVNHTVL